MCHILFSPAACPALQYFSTLSKKSYDLKKILTEYMCLAFPANFI
jgi:hypothetical protein